MKKLICKIFGHFDKTETTKIYDNGNTRTFNFKHTCKLCGSIRKGGYTSFEGPTITLNK